MADSKSTKLGFSYRDRYPYATGKMTHRLGCFSEPRYIIQTQGASNIVEMLVRVIRLLSAQQVADVLTISRRLSYDSEPKVDLVTCSRFRLYIWLQKHKERKTPRTRGVVGQPIITVRCRRLVGSWFVVFAC